MLPEMLASWALALWCVLELGESPRWHQGRLWVLESGNGGVGDAGQFDRTQS